MCYMKKATVRELRNHYTGLLKEVKAGQEILITQRGIPVAKLGPAEPSINKRADWAQCPEVLRDRSKEPALQEKAVDDLLKDSAGKW